MKKKDLSKTWKNLFDLTYFQGNIEYMLKGSNKSGAAQTVDDSALYQQDTEVKCSDGSLVYDREFRGWKQDAVDHAALEVANNGMFRLDYYTEPDAQRLAIFEKMAPVYAGEGHQRHHPPLALPPHYLRPRPIGHRALRRPVRHRESRARAWKK